MAYSPTKWFAPIDITASTNGFVLTEGVSPGTTFNLSISAGTYYAHADSTLNSSYPSLYLAIESAISASAATGTYNFSVATPTTSSLQTNAGVKLASGGGDPAFSVDFNDANFTLDNRYFGYPTQQANVSSSSNEVTSLYTVLSQWTAFTLTDNTASDQRSHVVREIMESSDRVSDAYQVEWNEDTIRKFVIEYVPAAHVHLGRDGDAGYASTGEISQNEENNAFETIWESASRLGEIIVQYDGISTMESIANAQDYEVVRFNDAQQRSDFSACYSMQRMLGELYRIDVDLYVVSGNYDH